MPNNPTLSRSRRATSAWLVRVLIAILFVCLNSGTAKAQVVPTTAPPVTARSLAEIRVMPSAYAEAVENCEQIWDRGTHMTNRERSRTCRRVQYRLRNLEAE